MFLDQNFKEEQVKILKTKNNNLSETEAYALGLKESKNIFEKYVDKEN